MDTNRFDRVSMKLANRLSRRTALRGLGGGIAAVGLAGSGLRQTAAQDATPVAATPAATSPEDKLFFMFIQTAQTGSFKPKTGEEGVYQVTLDEADARAIYFSDRPERIVGDVPMQQFLDGLGFSKENPPNAGIVTQTDAGEDTLVVELHNPVWDDASGTLTYDVRPLDDYQGDGLGYLVQQQDDAELPATFGHTSLFIDDCADITSCYNGVTYLGAVPGGPYGACWDWNKVACEPCSGGTRRDLVQQCKETYSDCGNLCVVH